jgi:uncharacterized protein (DUF58 family)
LPADTATPNAAHTYLDPATLAAIRPIELRARWIVEGLMTGMHRSPYQGFSVEFAQHRQYAPGDDIRFLDWKVYARTDKLYLKQYQKETNLDLVLLVDGSGSMAYGSDSVRSTAASSSWRKYDHAASLAAAMAYLALRQQDRVGVVLFDDKLRNATRMSNAQDHWRSIVEVLSSEPVDPSEARGGTDEQGNPLGRKTDLTTLFEQVNARTTQRSLIVVISDLFDTADALERGLARLHHRRHDVILLQVLDHAELDFPFRSPSEFVGLEGEGRLQLDPHALRKAYMDALQRHLRGIEEVARRFRFDHLLLDSSQSLGPPLSHFLARRSARLSKGK